MTWAKRLKRVFHIDIDICDACRGNVKITAAEDPTQQRLFDGIDGAARDEEDS